MRPLTANEVVAILRRNGFLFARQKGSHRIYSNPITGGRVTIPLYQSGMRIPIGTFLAIVKQSKLSKSEFEKRF